MARKKRKKKQKKGKSVGKKRFFFQREQKYLYFMRGTKWMYKIGISNDPKRRLKEVAHKPKIIATYRYYYAERIERFFHLFFKESRRTREGSGKTEWFRLGILEVFIVRLLMIVFKILNDSAIYILGIAVVVALLWMLNQLV